ncbi:MAG: Rieske (2Fe-2S) protein [Nitrospiraceae bacterium]|nr:Rieske (2Fe-2S) protein [Nitrospiraceae bacterium]
MERAPAAGVVWLLAEDAAVVRAVTRVCGEAGAGLYRTPPPSNTPCVALADASGSGPADLVALVRAALPQAYLLGFMAAPDPDGWRAAERAGFDEVVSRGALGPSLRRALARLAEGGGVRSYAICDAQDVAGRIGFLLETEVPGLGKVSLFREQGRLVCLGTCPHHGAPLGRGEIEDGVVTCPAHGSRFEILTGERVRGPSDFDVPCHGAYEQGGRIWVLPRP